MIELEQLYNIADREQICINNINFTNSTAMIIKEEEQHYIHIDYRKIDNPMQEKSVMLEELGHYYTGAYYNINTPKDVMNKLEYKAKKWGWKTAITYNDICNAVKQGCKDLWEFSDYFGLPEQTVYEALEYYKNNYDFSNLQAYAC